MTEDNTFGYGFMQPGDAGSRYNVLRFLIRQALAEVRTAIPVEVMAVSTSGGLSPIGTVDVTPLVNMVDGNGNATKHQTIFGLPYFRLQGGANAIIIDPVVGDQGLAIVSDRDISAVKSALAQAPPGSGRRFDLADATYFGCTMSGSAPTQYIQMNGSGVTITAPNGITLNGVTIDSSGNVNSPGTIKGSGTVDLETHKHSGVTTGAGQSGPPIPGT